MQETRFRIMRLAGFLKGSNLELILIYLICDILVIGLVHTSCDRIFNQHNYGSGGRFEGPSRVLSRPWKVSPDERGNLMINTTDFTSDTRPMYCIYKFIANEDERVNVAFSSFHLRGDGHECSQEYMEIYVKFKPEDNLELVLPNEPPNGRFCTSIMPRRTTSLYNMVVLIFYSDIKPSNNLDTLFSGNFEFFRSKGNDFVGQPEVGSLCSHTIYSEYKREGEFQSITYPGVYTKGLKCSYKFIGEPKQRIRLEFLDLDLYSGGPHCPLDSVKVFDGLAETDPIINVICGSHRSLIVYSTRETLMITFTTLQREGEIQNRGFSAYFEFSSKFVDPAFILGQNAKHIRGSECDQRIISYKATTGMVMAPDPTHHPNAVCRYIFEGLQTSNDYEKVLLKFREFDLKSQQLPLVPGSSTSTNTTTTTTTTTTQPPFSLHAPFTPAPDLGSAVVSNSSSDQCPDNYLRIYTSEQKPDQKQDPNDYDYIFCSNDVPQSIESDAASLLMEYNSGTIGGYFKADYEFIVDYRIPGTQLSSGCDYIYRGDTSRTGIFNSPRHPSWYINDINCTYTFVTKADEALLLQFNTFKMSNNFNEKVLGYNEVCEGEDRVEIFEISLDANERIIGHSEVGTYCGTTTPGPMVSYRPVRINFMTNKANVHYGFSALYGFYSLNALKSNEFVANCGGQILASARLRSGTIASPDSYRPETYEKRHHVCSWNITARPSHKIALDFNRFELEGSPLVRGCITASVRLDTGRSKKPVEICGSLAPTNGTAHQYVSENEWLSLSFVSTKQASGSNGFSATWTEIKRTSR